MKWLTQTVILVICIIVNFFPVYITAHTKKALIFGVAGQDGVYLAEFLLAKKYEVHGVKRATSQSNIEYLNTMLSNQQYKFFLHHGDIANKDDIESIIELVGPDEIYNLAAQSYVSRSFHEAEETTINALGVLRILEAIKKTNRSNTLKFYQASSSEMFGNIDETPQKETTNFHPRSPYAIAKLYGYYITINYRESYGLFACNGILFNHESPIRGECFVTRKITRTVSQIYHGVDTILYLGNLDIERDWGYAKDYVEVMWLMLQQEKPDDYIIATGHTHTVREFVELAFKEIGMKIGWQGSGLDEIGFDQATGKILVKIDQKYFRPAEVNSVLGDATKAYTLLKWKPSVSFEELVKIMVNADLNLITKNES